MRFLILGLAALAASSALSAQVHVRGFTTRAGTYVAPHYRSAPDGNPYNNWSSRGNVNPYTRQAGTRSPDSSGRPRAGSQASTRRGKEASPACTDPSSC